METLEEIYQTTQDEYGLKANGLLSSLEKFSKCTICSFQENFRDFRLEATNFLDQSSLLVLEVAHHKLQITGDNNIRFGFPKSVRLSSII